MRIAFCTTCKGRTQHIEQTLPKNMQDRDYKDARFILVDYSDPSGLQDYLRKNHQADVESGRLITCRYDDGGVFKIAHAKNMAHRLGLAAGADILVNVDADNYTGPGFARYVAEQFQAARGAPLFLRAQMIKGVLARGVNGRIVVSANTFLKSGGYDERFDRWSPDDKDFVLRLRRMGYHSQFIDQRFLNAINHNDRMRFKYEINAGGTRLDEQEWLGSQPTTIANFGRIGLGRVFCNFSNEPTELKPLPTRIFGIGMHKTGTVSLHHALKILRYDSAHWTSAHWAKAIWKEMTEDGRSPTLEKSYALCDLPLPLIYKELDKAYPGSKFILTKRNESGWLMSIQNHWNSESNPYRDSWNRDPFSHKVHNLLYGCQNFEVATMLSRYRQHNEEVLHYFKNRPNDLLVMDMDQGAGWSELCEFLEKPIPGVSYPRSNETARLATVSGE